MYVLWRQVGAFVQVLHEGKIMSKRVRGFHRRTDANHKEVLNAFRQLGCSVVDLRLVGKGCPDALVGYRGRDRLIEIKRPGKDPSADQERFYGLWKGAAPVVVRTVEDVSRLVRLWLS